MYDSFRYRGRNHHHMTPRSRGGTDDPWNQLLIKIERHNALHLIFGNRTIPEIIKILKRVQRRKEYRRRAA